MFWVLTDGRGCKIPYWHNGILYGLKHDVLRHKKKIEGKEYEDRTAETRTPVAYHPCPLQPLLLSDGSFSAVWALVLQRGMNGDKTTVSTVYVLLSDMVKGEDGRFGCEKYLTQKVVPAVEEVLFPPEVMHSCGDSILLLLVTVFMPGETFLIEGYDYLWALMIGLLGKHQIGLLRVFPAGEKDQQLSLDFYFIHSYSLSVLEIFKDEDKLYTIYTHTQYNLL